MRGPGDSTNFNPKTGHQTGHHTGFSPQPPAAVQIPLIMREATSAPLSPRHLQSLETDGVLQTGHAGKPSI